MKLKPIALAVIFISIAVAIPAFACIWDQDTIAMERKRFPGTLELITGKFLRHSQEFYEWRIQDRLQKLSRDRNNLNYYDDLAVAYDKTGQHQKAIETMLAKSKLKSGLYETEANLGTFYIHGGQLQKGVEHIDRAIQINPNAHFGREVYQKHLVNYVLSKQQDGSAKLPLEDSEVHSRYFMSMTRFPIGFANYIMEAQNVPRHVNEYNPYEYKDNVEQYDTELKKALKGVKGMMRFGNYDSPILLEVLGDLLLSGDIDSDAKQLAARAYLKASYELEYKAIQETYRTFAELSIELQQFLQLDALEERFLDELAEANRWFERVRADEIRWIKAGKNVEREFAQKYYTDPEVSSPTNIPIGMFILPLVGLILLGAVAVRRKRNAGRK
ncbi:MAG: hypothetical protein AB4352_06085 [Hormoscilla sp.]